MLQKGLSRLRCRLNWKIAAVGCGSLCAVSRRCLRKSQEGSRCAVWVRESYSIIFLVGLDVCCSLAIVEAWRMYEAWDELRRLLTFLDRLPLRRTLAVTARFFLGKRMEDERKCAGSALQGNFPANGMHEPYDCHSRGNHREPFESERTLRPAQSSLGCPPMMRKAGVKFAEWYSTNYTISRAGDLTSFANFRKVLRRRVAPC